MKFIYPHNISIEVPLALVNFAANPPTAEMGSTVTSVALVWGFNQNTDSVVVNGVTILDQRPALLVTGSFKTDQSWPIKGYLGTEKVSGNATLKFQNWGYWDVVTAAPTTSAGVRALGNKLLVDTRTSVKIGAACYTGKFPIYCYPTRLGIITKVKVAIPIPGSLSLTHWVSFTDLTTTSIKVTNGSGYTEGYSVTKFNSLPFTGFFEVDWA